MLRAFRDYREQIPTLLLITTLGFAAAVLEAFSLVLIVPVAEAVTSDAVDVGGRLGSMFGEQSRGTWLVVGTVTVGISTATRLYLTVLQSRFVAKVLQAEQIGLVDAYLAASLDMQIGERSGRLQALTNWTASHAQRLGQLVVTLRNLASVTVLLGAAIFVQPAGALIIAIAAVVFFVIFRPLVDKSSRAARDTAEAQLAMAEYLGEIENSTMEIQVFNAEAWAKNEFERRSEEFRVASVRSAVFGGLPSPLYQGIALVGVFALLGVAASADGLDLASIGTVALLLVRSLTYGQAFQASYQRVAESTNVTERFQELKQGLLNENRALGSQRLGSVSTVSIDNASFAYRDGSAALDRISLDLRAGERVGLVGASGAGKSTLALVLLRAFLTQTGDYRVNGVSATEFDAESWSREVTLVPQRPALLHGTVHDNITLFRSDLSRKEVEAAARSAAIHEAIVGLPLGYDTMIGPSTRALSGGQLQRLGIARALAVKPSFVILDEPTSSLDLENERHVKDSLQALPEDSIVLIIAHRMTTLEHCSRIVVLDHGRVVEDDRADRVAVESSYFEVST